MTELELIINLHLNSERQGPGSEEDTLKALNFMSLPENTPLNVADIGCGSGGPTLTLARHLHATITATDLFPEFLEELKVKAAKDGLDHKIRPLHPRPTPITVHSPSALIPSSKGILKMSSQKRWCRTKRTKWHCTRTTRNITLMDSILPGRTPTFSFDYQSKKSFFTPIYYPIKAV